MVRVHSGVQKFNAKGIVIVSFELNNQSFLEDWKKMSSMSSSDLEGIDGFIYRDSAVSEDKKVHCILKWNSLEQKQKFNKVLESREDWSKMMADFERIVNMQTMKQEILEVL